MDLSLAADSPAVQLYTTLDCTGAATALARDTHGSSGDEATAPNQDQTACNPSDSGQDPIFTVPHAEDQAGLDFEPLSLAIQSILICPDGCPHLAGAPPPLTPT